MWQPATNHEEAWEYLQLGLLWYGVPAHGDMRRYEDDFVSTGNWTKIRFIKLCQAQGTYAGFTHPHYILVEE